MSVHSALRRHALGYRHPALLTTRVVALSVATMVACAGLASSATASTALPVPDAAEAALVNDSTVGVVFTHEELYHQTVHDLEQELAQFDGLRIVPIISRNHVQAVYDLLYLQGVDVALIRSDALEYIRRQTATDAIRNSVRSITRISDEKIAILARKRIRSVSELADKRIGLGLVGTGEYITGTLVLEMLGIDARVQEISSLDAARQMRQGDLDAMVYLLATPDSVMSKVATEAFKHVRNLKSIDGVHVLSLPASDEMRAVYAPTQLDADDLPGVLAGDDTVDTYSVEAVLIARSETTETARQARVARFVTAFVNRLDKLKSGPYEPVWSSVALDATTTGLARMPLVEQTAGALIAEADEAEQARIEPREERAAPAQAARTAVLEEQKATINQKLDERVDSAGTEELEALLEQLNAFMNELDAEANGANEAAAH